MGADMFELFLQEVNLTQWTCESSKEAIEIGGEEVMNNERV
jgi:hypothetical protein